MFVLEIVIVIIIAVVSIFSHIAYSQTVKEKDARSQHKRAVMTPFRSLSEEEAAALRGYYDIEIPMGADVYRIEGGYDMTALEEDNKAIKIYHSIAGIHVTFLKEWEKYLDVLNRAEIVFVDDTGYILNLNGLMDIRQLLAMKEKIQQNTPGKVAAADIDIIGSRPMTPAEAKSAATDIRFWAWLSITVGLWCAFWNADNTVWLVVSSGLVVVGSVRYLLKKDPPVKKITRFSGRLLEKVTTVIRDGEVCTDENLYVGDVVVKFPDHWKPFLTFGNDYQVEGVLEIEAKSKPAADLVAAGDVLSVNTECERFGYAAVGRHIMGAFFLALSLFFLWFGAQQPATKIKMAWHALGHSGKPEHFPFIVQGAILIFCIALLSYLIVRIVVFMRWDGNRSSRIEQYYQSSVKQEPSCDTGKEKELNGAASDNSGLPDISSIRIVFGVMGSDGLKVVHVLFDGRNVWKEDGMVDPQPIPDVVTVKWGRDSQTEMYDATLRLDQEMVADYLTPYCGDDLIPMLTFIVKDNNEMLVVRTVNFNLDDDLLVFDTAKGIKCD